MFGKKCQQVLWNLCVMIGVCGLVGGCITVVKSDGSNAVSSAPAPAAPAAGQSSPVSASVNPAGPVTLDDFYDNPELINQGSWKNEPIMASASGTPDPDSAAPAGDVTSNTASPTAPAVTPAVDNTAAPVNPLGDAPTAQAAAGSTEQKVWIPNNVPAGWRPYTNGQWVQNDQYADPVWDSSDTFSSATFHYGQWVQLADGRWAWLPGTSWAPAWVVWRNGGGYAGWAPAPPVGVIAVNAIPATSYTFVDERYVMRPHVSAFFVPASRNVSIYSSTTMLTTISRTGISSSKVFRTIESHGYHFDKVRSRVVHTADEARLARSRGETPLFQQNTGTGRTHTTDPRALRDDLHRGSTPTPTGSTPKTLTPDRRDTHSRDRDDSHDRSSQNTGTGGTPK